MTKPLQVCFLWHMHQPYYINDLTGQVSLPWVRLHATKAYLDTIAVLEEHPEMACTINVVPSLLAQLRAYENGHGLKDDFLDVTRKPAAELSADERRFVLRYFFMSNWDTMVRPFPGYARLLERRGMACDPDSIDNALRRFSTQDLLDLQVWFNLSWFGFTARRDERAAFLIKKDSGFAEEDKELLLETQADMLARVIPGWKRLLEAGRVELSTSAFYHPILPILIGSQIARRAMPDANLPGDFSYVDDAREQIRRGMAYYEQTFGRPPVGIWPSEGSVCPELVPLLAEAGLTWMATDEGILLRSLPNPAREHDLYHVYDAAHGGKQIAAFFRDRYLSDLVGFTYSKNPPEIAAQDLLGHLGRIAQANPGGTVSIVLDGENPWEYYPDSGETFLHRVFGALTTSDHLRPLSMREAVAETPARQVITNLHSGSWINANYRIWIGGEEENQAWALLDRTRSTLTIARQSGKVPPDKLATATEQLLQAEGSDWFWWFGDDFNSENDAEFDRLFRERLANVYTLIGQRPPASLDEPIHVERENLLVTQPLALIHPQLDGELSNYYEWNDAGYIDVHRVRGSMHLSKNLMRGFYFGFDRQHLFLRFDPSEELLLPHREPYEIRVHLSGPVERQIRFACRFGDRSVHSYEMLALGADNLWEPLATYDKVCANSIVELAIPFEALNASPGQALWFVVRLMKGEIEEDRFPKNGRVLIYVPDENYDSINWSV